MRSRHEFSLSGICHLLNTIPLWGLLACGCIWYAMREESRMVVGQARQAMAFHGLLLAGLLVFILLELVSQVLRVLWMPLGQLLSMANQVLILGVYAAYAGVCLWGAWRCFSRQGFNYPFLGVRR